MEAEAPAAVLSRSPEETEAFGEILGRELCAGSLVALVGELGSGKTTLVRGLARGLGVSEPITSPTFTRLRELPGRLTLYHFDAWRDGCEALLCEAQEYLAGEGVAVVEWADRVERWLPRPRLEIGLSHRGPRERELALRVVAGLPPQSPSSLNLEEALRGALERARRAIEPPVERP